MTKPKLTPVNLLTYRIDKPLFLNSSIFFSCSAFGNAWNSVALPQPEHSLIICPRLLICQADNLFFFNLQTLVRVFLVIECCELIKRHNIKNKISLKTGNGPLSSSLLSLTNISKKRQIELSVLF